MAALTYERVGVDYGPLDAFKRACQQAATTTTAALAAHGMREPEAIRGESAYLIETPTEYLAHVEEGLGTKNLVAQAMHQLTGRSFYANIGVDVVATITNDLITTGALPVSVAMHAGVGSAAWFVDHVRADDLARGFAEGCRRSGAVWGGGETPALSGLVHPEGIVLAGSALGRIAPKSNRVLGDVREGDAMVFLASSGVQTNGLTLCRAIADRVEGGYLAPIADGRSYGEALLDASVIYVSFLDACQRAGIRLHYAVHVTGHGWRKLMRLSEPFVYRVTNMGPTPPAVFEFLRAGGPVEPRELYATLNMGVGFAVYVDPSDAARCVAIAESAGYTAWIAGAIAREGARRAVVIAPLGIVFESDTLHLR
jgi:phosphoribosylformylglycinamidine cyclo-ligase